MVIKLVDTFKLVANMCNLAIQMYYKNKRSNGIVTLPWLKLLEENLFYFILEADFKSMIFKLVTII